MKTHHYVNLRILARLRQSAQVFIALSLIFAVFCGGIFIAGWLTQTTLYQQEQSDPAPGKMVYVAGEWVHLRCEGSTSLPVLFLESGVMGWSTVWSWMFEQAKNQYRVCSWDRAGLGWSKPTRRPADAASSSALLHALVHQERIKTPFVLMGHSLGGMYSIVYQRMYPEDVRALILVDPAHPQQLGRLPGSAVNRTVVQVGRIESSLPLMDFGVGRGVMEWRTDATMFKLPASSRSAVIHVTSSKDHMMRSVKEYQAWPKSSKEALSSKSLGDLPLLVISSSDRERGDRASNEAWWEMHRKMASLSSSGVWTVIPGSAHQSLIMYAEFSQMVLDQADQVVPKVSSKINGK